MTENEAIELIENDLKLHSKDLSSKYKNGLRMAINALEKQIPKKVITSPCNSCNKELCDCECEHFAVTYRDDYRCPTCDSNGVYMQEYELRFDCCPNCGQKLDWSDEK